MPALNTIRQNLTGQTFGRLTVLGLGSRLPCKGRKNGRQGWLCHCVCGNCITAVSGQLTTGNTTSCGCYVREITILRNKKGRSLDAPNWTHMPEYEVWVGMVKRCENPNAVGHANYGGRGITVCDHWRASFQNFLEDMGERPSAEYSIERIDNDKDYTPENCKWATAKEQAHNKRNNVRLTYRGETLCASDWGKRLNTSASTIIGRLRLGWSIERIVTTPVHKCSK